MKIRAAIIRMSQWFLPAALALQSFSVDAAADSPQSDVKITILRSRKYSPNQGPTCGPRGNQALKDLLPSTIIDSCKQDFDKNKCEEFKAGLDPYDQPSVMNCEDPNTNSLNPVSFAVSCGGGLVNFAWDTVKGFVDIPSALAEWDAAETACNSNIELKKQILAPVAMVLPENVYNYYLEGDCIGLRNRVLSTQISYNQSIPAKEQALADYRVNPIGDPPPQVTEAERAYKAYQADNNPDIVAALMGQLNKELACYSAQAKAALACKTMASVASLAFGGIALSAFTKSPKILALIADLREQAALARAEKLGEDIWRAPELPVCSPQRNGHWLPNQKSTVTSGLRCSLDFPSLMQQPGFLKPQEWTDELYAAFKKEAEVAKNTNPNRPLWPLDGKPKMSLQTLQNTICKSGTRSICKPGFPKISYEAVGKVLIKYERTEGLSKVLDVRVNMSQGSYYLTVKNGDGAYMTLDGGVFQVSHTGAETHFPFEGVVNDL